MKPALVSLLLAGCVACTALEKASPDDAQLTHGTAVGDVSATRAVIWGRCSGTSTLRLRIATADGRFDQTAAAGTSETQDFTGRVVIDDLDPNTAYMYRVWCGDNEASAVHGRFSTPPPSTATSPVRFVWGGDLGGQNVCRDTGSGYTVFDVIHAESPAFFIGLGDLIYADDGCKPVGRYGNAQIPGPTAPAITRQMFWEHWKYNRADPAFQRLLAATAVYPVWDDHEVTNDAGPLSPMLQPALQAFLDYQPILPPAEAPPRVYQTVRWGKLLEVFILDLRQYRDANRAQDSATQPKTMLGEEQRRWLLERLSQSDATWKVIVSSVPLSIPTGTPGAGHDGWTGYGDGDGFEHERRLLLRAMSRTTSRNYVWITTDVHFGAAFRYRPFEDDPQFVLHEVVSGPLNAGVFPQEAYDRTLGTERLFKYGPATAASIVSFDEALGWFNFGVIEIDAGGAMAARLVDARGRTVYQLHLAPE